MMTISTEVKTIRLTRAVLAGVAAFTAFWALAGAIGLAGGGADLGAAVEARLPLHSPVLAAVLLGLLVAVPMAATAAAVIRNDHRAAAMAVCSGALLVGWVAVQPIIIGQFFWLQPVFGLLGLTVAGLGLSLNAHRGR